jgi:endonuclease YncB( thermonuclease family)
MSTKKFRPRRRAPSLRPTRKGAIRALWLAPILLLAGALLDPAIIAPVGPLAAQPERVSAVFTRCGKGGAVACVVDGDSFRLGDRTIRITGIDAPELGRPLCPAEAALASRSADRLVQLLNQGEFDMVAHRLQRLDRHDRELMILWRGNESIGDTLIADGLAHRYLGSKRRWC